MAKALIVVDVQVDFCEGGSLAVTGGNAVAERISRYLEDNQDSYDRIIATKDYHIEPGDHFAREGEEPDYVNSWPPHCVVGTSGVEFHPEIEKNKDMIDELVLKGMGKAAYSGFEGIDATDLYPFIDYLIANNITHVDICGIATDFCVKATALDSIANGFTTKVLVDLCAGVAEESSKTAQQDMLDAGVILALAGH